MTRYALIAALCACLCLLGALWWQSGALDASKAQAASLARSVAVQTASLDQARLSADVAAARAERAQKEAAASTATVEAILTATLGECADANIDPALADILRGVQRAD